MSLNSLIVLDLLSKMITWDPDQRLTVIQALEHPWLANYHDPMDEPACPTKFDRYKDYEGLTTLDEFRTAIWDEIQDFRKEVRSLHPESPSSILSEADEHNVATCLDEDGPAASPITKVSDEFVVAAGTAAMSTETTRDIPHSESVGQQPYYACEGPAPPEPNDLPAPARRDPSTLTTDPIASYRRRSSVLQPGVSPHAHARGPSQTQHQSFPSSAAYDSVGEASYIMPARSRAASMMGGQLLRTLSTFSIHEQVDDVYSKIIATQKTGADAPPSSIPREFVRTDKE